MNNYYSSSVFTLLSLCLVAVTLVNSQRSPAIVCPECSMARQRTCNSTVLQCKFGETTDSCGCCPVCYKGINENCGGSFWFGFNAGRCTPGLVCMPNFFFPGFPGICVEMLPSGTNDNNDGDDTTTTVSSTTTTEASTTEASTTTGGSTTTDTQN